ncbi:MAG: hypothetical protein ABL907_14990 [Hyphomicrobium sp.]
MPRGSLQATLAIVVLASAAGVIAAPRPPQREHFLPGDHPAAVLAWASTRCGNGLALARHAAKAHAEVVMMVSAAFENAARFRPLTGVCAEALGLAGLSNRDLPAARPVEAPRVEPAQEIAHVIVRH